MPENPIKVEVRVDQETPQRKTNDLDALLRKLKHELKKDYHIARKLPTDDKIHFLSGYYSQDEIFKSED